MDEGDAAPCRRGRRFAATRAGSGAWLRAGGRANPKVVSSTARGGRRRICRARSRPITVGVRAGDHATLGSGRGGRSGAGWDRREGVPTRRRAGHRAPRSAAQMTAQGSGRMRARRYSTQLRTIRADGRRPGSAGPPGLGTVVAVLFIFLGLGADRLDPGGLDRERAPIGAGDRGGGGGSGGGEDEPGHGRRGRRIPIPRGGRQARQGGDQGGPGRDLPQRPLRRDSRRIDLILPSAPRAVKHGRDADDSPRLRPPRSRPARSSISGPGSGRCRGARSWPGRRTCCACTGPPATWGRRSGRRRGPSRARPG